MNMEQNQKVAVFGVGLMGHGIALTLARAGRRVSIIDPSVAALASLRNRISDALRLLSENDADIAETLERIEACESVEAAVDGAAFVFEAAPEQLPLKRAIFSAIDAHAPEDAVLASISSTFPMSRIVKGLRCRHRALGTHWWNPPHMIPLVEVVRSEWTSDSAMATTMQFLVDLGKTPIAVEREIPGFIGNRLQHALWREAVHLVERGVCSAEDVDAVVKSSFGRNLAVLGPLENADFIGTDITLELHRNILSDLDCRGSPSPYLWRLVFDGHRGMSTGRGFRTWARGEAEAVRRRFGRHLQRLDRILRT